MTPRRPDVIDAEDVFVARARRDPDFLTGIFEEAESLLAEGDDKTCGLMLQTYVVAAEKLAASADFLNKSEAEMLEALKTPGGLTKPQLEKLIEFLKL
ncbi:MAG: hypothetical protein EA357_06390 [Micavibrio sp.]|nr:MAG: hypothetical protein EA357_06390 [Micavibrio sp.]